MTDTVASLLAAHIAGKPLAATIVEIYVSHRTAQ